MKTIRKGKIFLFTEDELKDIYIENKEGIENSWRLTKEKLEKGEIKENLNKKNRLDMSASEQEQSKKNKLLGLTGEVLAVTVGGDKFRVNRLTCGNSDIIEELKDGKQRRREIKTINAKAGRDHWEHDYTSIAKRRDFFIQKYQAEKIGDNYLMVVLRFVGDEKGGNGAVVLKSDRPIKDIVAGSYLSTNAPRGTNTEIYDRKVQNYQQKYSKLWGEQ